MGHVEYNHLWKRLTDRKSQILIITFLYNARVRVCAGNSKGDDHVPLTHTHSEVSFFSTQRTNQPASQINGYKHCVSNFRCKHVVCLGTCSTYIIYTAQYKCAWRISLNWFYFSQKCACVNVLQRNFNSDYIVNWNSIHIHKRKVDSIIWAQKHRPINEEKKIRTRMIFMWV